MSVYLKPEVLGADDGSTVPLVEAREELERVLASPSFRRSPTSQKFLRYVCEMKFRGEGSRINEYLLGHELFSRGADYSTSEDAVVRRSAHTVRRKLDEFYANGGHRNRVRIEIPVGHYEPVFRLQKQPAPAARSRLSIVGMAAGCAVVALCGWAAGRYTGTPVRIPPAVVEIWGPWLGAESISIVFANSKSAVVHHVPDERLEDNHPLHFPLAPAAETGMRREFGFPSGGYLFMRPTELKTAIAESAAGVQLSQFFGKWGVPVKATQSRLLNWDDLRGGRYILLGHNESNPWVDKLLEGYPMRLGDGQGIQRFITIDQPLAGEAPQYAKEVPGGNRPVVEYALISMLRGYRPGTSILLVSGLDGQATQLAAEYLSREADLRDLTARLRQKEPRHSGPWHFQFVLRAEVRDKVPTRAELGPIRVLTHPPK